MLGDVIDDALVFAGRERGWRPDGGEILFGFDVQDEEHALRFVGRGSLALVVESVTSGVDRQIWFEAPVPEGLKEAAVDRWVLERWVRAVVRSCARLVIRSGDGSLVELQEWWKAPLRRFERVEQPDWLLDKMRLDLDLAYAPERYNTQQLLIARSDLEASLEKGLGVGAELVGMLRRGESAQDFAFEAHGIHSRGLGRWSSEIFDAVDPVQGAPWIGRIDRCLNGTGVAVVEYDGDVSIYLPADQGS